MLGLLVFPNIVPAEEPNPFTAPGTLIVFAHQDDDLLWMQPFLDSAEILLLAASPSAPAYDRILSRHPEEYQARWHAAFPPAGSDQAWLSDYGLKDRCLRDQEWTYAHIQAAIDPWVAKPEIRRVVTHNPWGEYGHIHHRLLHQAVRDSAVRYGKDVWMLNSVVLIHGDGAVYLDLGDWGLPAARTTFDTSYFHKIRAIYQEVYFAGDPPGIDTWSWHDGPMQFPHGERTYIKAVAAGVDLIRERPLVARQAAVLSEFVPLRGACPGRRLPSP
jgi:hypothetical protein